MKIVLQDEILEGPRVKGSRFIGFILYVDNFENIKKKLHDIQQEHPQASHVCYAWILEGRGERFSDDGEPHGSAGKPILQHIKGKKLTNVLAVSVRYYGGKKLGVGGLVRAYSSSISSVLEKVQLKDYIKYVQFQCQYEYALRSKVQRVFANCADFCTDIDHQFMEQITTTIQIPLKQVEYIQEALKDSCNGRIVFLQ